MSLINQMLSDLDRRQAQIGQTDLQSLGVLPVGDSPILEGRRLPSRGLIGFFGLVVLIACVFFSWFGFQGRPSLTKTGDAVAVPSQFSVPVDGGAGGDDGPSRLPATPLPLDSKDVASSGDGSPPSLSVMAQPVKVADLPGVTPSAGVPLSPDSKGVAEVENRVVSAGVMTSPSGTSLVSRAIPSLLPSSAMLPEILEEESVEPAGVVVAPEATPPAPSESQRPSSRMVPFFMLGGRGKQGSASIDSTRKGPSEPLAEDRISPVVAAVPYVAPLRRVNKDVGAQQSGKQVSGTSLRRTNGLLMVRTVGGGLRAVDSIPWGKSAQSMVWARTLLEDGQLDQAEKVVKEQMDKEGESAAALGIMAVLEQRRGNMDASNRHYNRLLELEPGQYRWWLGMAVNLDQSNRSAEAIDFYKHLLNMKNVDDHVVRFSRERLLALRIKEASGVIGDR